MKCLEFERRLNELLDERAPLDLDDALAQHHRQCGECQKLLRAYQDMLAAVRLCEPPRLEGALAGEEFARAVVAQVCASRAPRKAAPTQAADTPPAPRGVVARHWRRVALAATAAAVFLAVSFRPRPVPDAPEPAPIAAQPAQPAIGDLARDATDRYIDLARETRNGLSDVMTLVSNASAIEAPAEDEPSASPPASLLAVGGAGHLAEDLADGLRPLAKSTLGAMSFLFSPEHNPDAGRQTSGEDKTL